MYRETDIRLDCSVHIQVVDWPVEMQKWRRVRMVNVDFVMRTEMNVCRVHMCNLILLHVVIILI